MVPLITMTALAPAGHFPLRYAELTRARAFCTDATGFAGSAPELESSPPAETYHAGLWGEGLSGPGVVPGSGVGPGSGAPGSGTTIPGEPETGGFRAGSFSSPDIRVLPQPAASSRKKTTGKKKIVLFMSSKTCLSTFWGKLGPHTLKGGKLLFLAEVVQKLKFLNNSTKETAKNFSFQRFPKYTKKISQRQISGV
jgi:hypothetical protein